MREKAMTAPATSHVSHRAQQLRHDFDRRFGMRPSVDEEISENLIAIRIGEHQFAIRLSEIAGLHADKTITRVPGANATMLGIAGFRGEIAPVYDFASLLGYARSENPRWLIVSKQAPVAFAFEAFDGHFSVGPQAIRPQQSQDGVRPHVRDFVQTDAGLRPVIAVSTLVNSLKT
jgi:purine-binding chemotaxis protein CheW